MYGLWLIATITILMNMCGDCKDDDGDSINDDVRVALESLVHSRHPRPLWPLGDAQAVLIILIILTILIIFIIITTFVQLFSIFNHSPTMKICHLHHHCVPHHLPCLAPTSSYSLTGGLSEEYINWYYFTCVTSVHLCSQTQTEFLSPRLPVTP